MNREREIERAYERMVAARREQREGRRARDDAAALIIKATADYNAARDDWERLVGVEVIA